MILFSVPETPIRIFHIFLGCINKSIRFKGSVLMKYRRRNQNLIEISKSGTNWYKDNPIPQRLMNENETY